MDVSEAEFNMEMAFRRLSGCEAHLQRASAAYLDAEAARGDNRRHYRLRRKHGDNYRQQLTDQWKFAIQQHKEAQAQLDKATREYDKAVADPEVH